MQTLKERFDEYLNTKYSENTKRYIFAILTGFEKIDDNGTPLPVKAKELQRILVPNVIPYLGVYYRLLRELGTDDGIGIIEKITYPREKGQRGKNPVYYQLNAFYKNW
jgi:hypothetical protein